MTKEQLDADHIFVIRDFLSPPECAEFVARSEEAGYEEATITTAAGFVMNKNVRDNARLIVDDVDLAARLWRRAQPFVPPQLREWRALGLNERFRYYRYDPGQKFAPHYDGCFQRDDWPISAGRVSRRGGRFLSAPGAHGASHRPWALRPDSRRHDTDRRGGDLRGAGGAV